MSDAKPWRVEENAAGFVYVVDHDGKKICTVYGSDEVKLQRAMAIAELPVLLAEKAKPIPPAPPPPPPARRIVEGVKILNK